MTNKERPLYDCPDPCACYAEGYAAGKEKTYFEIEIALQDDTHAAGCGCQPCRVKRACLQRAMTLITSGSLALQGHDYWNLNSSGPGSPSGKRRRSP